MRAGFTLHPGSLTVLLTSCTVHANYSDLLIDLELREMVPEFIVPLSRRGTTLKDLISQCEDDLVDRGVLMTSRSRAAQEAFIEIVEMSMFPRFDRVAEVSRALRSEPVSSGSESADPLADGAEQSEASN